MAHFYQGMQRVTASIQVIAEPWYRAAAYQEVLRTYSELFVRFEFYLVEIILIKLIFIMFYV